MAKEKKKNDNHVIDLRSAEDKVASAIQDQRVKATKSGRQLVALDLCFENVEAYSIPVEAINTLWIENVKHDISFDINRKKGNRFSDAWHCDTLDLVLDFEKTNEIKTWQSQKDDGSLDKDEDRLGLADRVLRYNDLVDVDLHFSDGSHQDIYVKYEDPFNEDTNARMRSALGQDRDGNKLLYLYLR